MRALFFLVQICCGLLRLSAVRNAKEEAVCAPFLTSKSSSPLIASLERNLRYDEEAEFSCELVLQDESLPLQIRMTIHEGLYYLALRHIAMGLHRERTAARHAKLMAIIVPDSFRFHYFAGSWALHHQVNDLQEARKQLRECLYGNASLDKDTTTEERYLAHRDYVRALLALRQLDEAKLETRKMLLQFPLDFDTYFLAQSLHDDSVNNIVAFSYLDTIRSIIEQSNLPSQPADDISSSIITKNDINSLSSDIAIRCPVLYHLGSINGIDDTLSWRLSSWFHENEQTLNLHQLAAAVDEEEEVLVEVAPIQESFACPEEANSSCVLFGAGVASHRRIMRFRDIIEQNFVDNTENTSLYINVQEDGSGNPPYHAPLHVFRDDLSLNHSVFDIIRSNVTDINLWMSHNTHPSRPTASRLHRDAKDNLYIVLQGTKQFRIWSPRHFAAMKTISPSYALNDDSLSHQFNMNHFRSLVLEKVNNQVNETNFDFHSLHPIFQELLSNRVQYEQRDAHFSTLSSHHPDLLPPPTAVVTLQAGDVLYLPTGWFHEVSSLPGFHAAINVWWMPPHWKEALQMEAELSAKMYDELWRSLMSKSEEEVNFSSIEVQIDIGGNVA